MRLYESSKVKERKPKFKLNDTVTISRFPRAFQKSYTQTFGEEYFFIDKVMRTSPIVYRLRDLLGEKMEGNFYAEELQKITVDPMRAYKIEKVLARKGNKMLVKFQGWPKKFNEWIPKKRAKKL